MLRSKIVRGTHGWAEVDRKRKRELIRAIARGRRRSRWKKAVLSAAGAAKAGLRV
jgi:hypothetical protein